MSEKQEHSKSQLRRMAIMNGLPFDAYTKDEVEIRYFIKEDKYRFEITYGKYKLAGFGLDLQEAEEKAQFALSGLPPHGMVHSIYECGKKPTPRKIRDEKK